MAFTQTDIDSIESTRRIAFYDLLEKIRVKEDLGVCVDKCWDNIRYLWFTKLTLQEWESMDDHQIRRIKDCINQIKP